MGIANRVSGVEKVAVLSNYSWAYLSTAQAMKGFPLSRITLVTASVRNIIERHDFGTEVIELDSVKIHNMLSALKRIGSLRHKGFDAAVIDYGFSISTFIMIFMIPFRKIYIIDRVHDNALKPITRLAFMGLFAEKLPYFLNKLLVEASKSLRLTICLGSPSEISIETSTVCNLKCKGCPTGLGQLNRPATYMPGEFFDEVIDNNRKSFSYLDIVYPFIFGEPLLNKDIFRYIERLRRVSSPYTRIELHTNGNIADSKNIASRLMKSGLDLINISVDGTDREAYESFRVGGKFETVCNFVRDLSSAKKEMGLLSPEIVVQMIVTRFSEDQIGLFKQLREDLGADRLVYKRFFHEFTALTDEEGYSLAPSKKGLLHAREEKAAAINKKRNACGWAYRSLSIMCNGNITPCCIDYNTSLVDGINLYGSTIKKLWNSPRYRRFRKEMLSGKLQVCNKCFFS